MTVLERLRKRSGFLVTAVGVALLAFVLTGLFESKYSLFKGKQYVGTIDGQKIALEDFERELSKMEEQQMENMGGGSLDAQMKEMVNNNTWDKLVRDMTLKKQIDNSGITVTDDELGNMILGKDPDPSVKAAFTDQQTGKVNPNFADANGNLNGAKIKEYVDKLQDPNGKTKEQQDQAAEYYEKWKKFEQSLRENRYSTKYFTMIKKGLYCSKTYAKKNYTDNGASVKFRYVLKRYMTVPDSQVKVTEDEIQKYYNENQKKYKQDASRKIEYVVWDVLPSQKDEEDAMKEMTDLGKQFQSTKSKKEDSLFVMRESETKTFDNSFIKKNQLPSFVDSGFFNAPKGSVLGPFKDGNKVKLVKLEDEKLSIDSGTARHILINYAGASQADSTVKRTKDQAKKLADSLLAVLKKSTKNFPDFVVKYSSDSGSVRENDKNDPTGKKRVLKPREKLGSYTFPEGQMMKAFQDVVWNGKVGDLKIAETPYGYHIMEVKMRSPETRKVNIVTIEKTILPSRQTKQEVFDKANDFAIRYNTPELFSKGIEQEKLNKRIADPVKESDKTIAGLESPRDMIKWAFANPQGTISADPFNFGNKYVVALISEVREKGIAPLEQKRVEVEIGAKQEKKAQMFIDEFKKSLAGGMNIDAFATKIGLPVEIVDNVTFGSYSIPNLGKEGNVMGEIFALKEGQLSEPIKGFQGVYIVVVDKYTPAPDTKDYTGSQKQVMQNLQYRVDQDLFNAMKTKADVEDNRGKYY